MFEQEYMCVPHTPKKRKKKFILERRYVGPMHPWYKRDVDWQTYRRYRTEEDMMKGFQAASSSSKWEYRTI